MRILLQKSDFDVNVVKDLYTQLDLKPNVGISSAQCCPLALYSKKMLGNVYSWIDLEIAGDDIHRSCKSGFWQGWDQKVVLGYMNKEWYDLGYNLSIKLLGVVNEVTHAKNAML